MVGFAREITIPVNARSLNMNDMVRQKPTANRGIYSDSLRFLVALGKVVDDGVNGRNDCRVHIPWGR